MGVHPNGAKYTRSRPPLRVEAVWETETKEDALKLEYRFKRLTKEKKEKIISGAPFDDAFGGRLDQKSYTFRPDLTGDVGSDVK